MSREGASGPSGSTDSGREMPPGVGGWLRRRRLRYKRHPIAPFESVRPSLDTGDIILFHKTTRNGLIDAIELDFVSPLLFGQNEFRHSGIVLRDGDELFVLECAEPMHSGHSRASYPTGGQGIRLVPLEPLLQEYSRDNGQAHFGVKLISEAIPLARVREVLAGYGPVSYLRMNRSVPIFASQFLLPRTLQRGLMQAFRDEMMCSEFVHSVLNRCGVLRDYPSKLLGPYSFENDELFASLELVRYSRIVRFGYDLTAGAPTS